MGFESPTPKPNPKSMEELRAKDDKSLIGHGGHAERATDAELMDEARELHTQKRESEWERQRREQDDEEADRQIN
jgi:hypothetical protein